MLKNNHTPGPWVYKHYDICGPDDEDGDDTVIGTVGVSYGLRSGTYSIVRKGPEMEANARLMVAAPDMLSALIMMDDADTLSEIDAALKAVRSAIEKATNGLQNT